MVDSGRVMARYVVDLTENGRFNGCGRFTWNSNGLPRGIYLLSLMVGRGLPVKQTSIAIW
jgi:hypothetical protein